MKWLIIGVLMLLIPAGLVFWLCATSTWGWWRTTGIFTVVIVWSCVAVDLMYKGAKKLK